MWTDAGNAQLLAWGLSPQQAEEAGLFEVSDAAAVLGDVPHRPGIVIPYYQPDGAYLHVNKRPFGRVRWTGLQQASGFGGKIKAARYGQPRDTFVQVYFPPLRDWAAALLDPTVPFLITEGEAKAITASFYKYNCIALGGVYSFANGGELVKVLSEAVWKNRPVVICYDSDAATNPDVLAAEARLVEELGTKRGAQVRIVRLPSDGDSKVGLDDFLHLAGPDELDRLIEDAPNLGALDAKIIGLNRNVAWIEHEARVLDLTSGKLINKADFVNGSVYSSLTHITRGAKAGETKTVSVAERWLKHPHAQRYADLLFRPGEPLVLPSANGAALNLWKGWTAEPGDVAPFLELNNYLMHKETVAEVRELPLKLLAYKAQHPQEKIPLGVVMTGPQGSGKSFWMESARQAFAPYSTSIEPGALSSDFHPWLEKSIIATINELDVETMRKNAQLIMALISDSRRQLNDKFRLMREIESPTLYFISSNYSGVGSGFTHDDRRIVSVLAPKKGPDDMYDRLWNWRRAGGEKHLMQYLLDMDLKGWQPPRTAPRTAAKQMAYREGLNPIQLLAEDMRTSDFNTLLYWMSLADEWAAAAEIGTDVKLQAQARAVRTGIQQIQIRPWYTAEELTLVFPTVLAQVYSTRQRETWTPGGLSRVLRDTGIPFLVNSDDTEGFMWHGKVRQYLVISQFSDWEQAISQADFERNMRNWPTYGEATSKRTKR